MVYTKQNDMENLALRWRFLWQHLSYWIREYMVAKSLKADPVYLNEIKEKILTIIDEFGDMMRTFFGDIVADEYLKLFTSYIMLFISFIDALSENNISKANEVVKELYESVEQRAKYLFNVNPYWDRATLDEYIFTFTSMTIQEITTFMSKQYKESVDLYEKILSYSIAQSDFLAQGAKKYLTYKT